MREEHIITSDYCFIDKEGEYFAKLIMRAEAGRNMMRLFFLRRNMMRLFFLLSDGRKIGLVTLNWTVFKRTVQFNVTNPQ